VRTGIRAIGCILNWVDPAQQRQVELREARKLYKRAVRANTTYASAGLLPLLPPTTTPIVVVLRRGQEAGEVD
jgi:hypothetical protein